MSLTGVAHAEVVLLEMLKTQRSKVATGQLDVCVYV